LVKVLSSVAAALWAARAERVITIALALRTAKRLKKKRGERSTFDSRSIKEKYYEVYEIFSNHGNDSGVRVAR
jgi:hypothetical protein